MSPRDADSSSLSANAAAAAANPNAAAEAADPNAARRKAQNAQREARRIDANVWVRASAGSGKTRSLTERALVALLDGAAPDGLLCLTYTRNAAAEMSKRIHRRMSDWSAVNDAELEKDLNNLLERKPDDAIKARARGLFAQAMESAEGLTVRTIHAFCERLLRRFPAEAGVSPSFSVDDKDELAFAFSQARRDALADEAALGAWRRQVGVISVDDADKLFRAVVENRHELLNAFDDFSGVQGADSLEYKSGVQGAADALDELMGLARGETPDLTDAALLDDPPDVALLRETCEHVLNNGTPAQKRDVGVINEFLVASRDERRDLLSSHLLLFLTKTRQPRKTGAPKAHPAFHDEAQRLAELLARRDRANASRASHAALLLARRFLEAHQLAKQRAGALDFDDLIHHTRRLLADDGAAWIHYKLDSGLQHILVDEAQDVSPAQWDVVLHLAQEFFAGDGAHHQQKPRTVFIVGDEKQSIYRFQGADPVAYQKVRDKLSEYVHHHPDAPLLNPQFNASFRSAPNILKAVDLVFPKNPPHHAARSDASSHNGVVRVHEPQKLYDNPKKLRARTKRLLCAKQVAKFADNLVRNEGVNPGGVLVLMRKRNDLFRFILRELHQAGLSVAGSDRPNAADDLAAQDLLALARCAALPQDDFSLAAFLKSPLAGLDDDALFSLAAKRPHRQTLHESLRLAAKHDPTCKHALNVLADAQKLLQQRPLAGEFFAEILAKGARRLLLAHNPLSNWILDALLDRAFNPRVSLRRFLQRLDADPAALEFKREGHAETNAVQIMTCHGAKGLEADVVLLVADHVQDPADARPNLLFIPQNPQHNSPNAQNVVPFWAKSNDARGTETALNAENLRKQADLEEDQRLLYVSLTRAKNQLHVFGLPQEEPKKDQEEPRINDWRVQVARAWENHADVLQNPGAEPDPDPDARPDSIIHADALPLPAWTRARVPHLSPNRPAPLRRKRGSAQSARFGALVHELLQRLPNIPTQRRKNAALRFLQQQNADPNHPALDDSLLLKAQQQALNLLNHPPLAPFFTPPARSEAPLAGKVNVNGASRFVSVSADKLLVHPNEPRVLVLEIKTGEPPKSPENIPKEHLSQLSVYQQILQKAHPSRSIEACFAWSDPPTFMRVPDSLLNQLPT